MGLCSYRAKSCQTAVALVVDRFGLPTHPVKLCNALLGLGLQLGPNPDSNTSAQQENVKSEPGKCQRSAKPTSARRRQEVPGKVKKVKGRVQGPSAEVTQAAQGTDYRKKELHPGWIRVCNGGRTTYQGPQGQVAWDFRQIKAMVKRAAADE